MTKLNFGSGPKIRDGYINVDGLDWDGSTDILHDFNFFPYPFLNCYADEILMMEFLEHLSFRATYKVLQECYRILKRGGKVKIQVPDIGKMCKYYVERFMICDCVPRKAARYEDYKGDPRCPKCYGKAKINTERWRFAFAGAQKHKYDGHLNHFTKEILEKDLEKVGFKNIKFSFNIYKLVVEATK